LALHLVACPESPMYFRIARGNMYSFPGVGAEYRTSFMDWILAKFCDAFMSVYLPVFCFHQWRRHVNFLMGVPKVLANFSAKKANCFSETDRKFVESVIAALYGTLENFDEHVRGSLASKINGVVGTEFTPSFPLPVIYKAISIPLFVCVGMDHGLMWNSKSLMSLLLTLGLVLPGFCCMLAKLLSIVPPMHKWLDFWFVFFLFNGSAIVPSEDLLAASFQIHRTWKVVVFEGMRWGLLSRERGFEDLAVQCPVDLPTLLVFGGFLLMEKLWPSAPLTDKVLSRK